MVLLARASTSGVEVPGLLIAVEMKHGSHVEATVAVIASLGSAVAPTGFQLPDEMSFQTF